MKKSVLVKKKVWSFVLTLTLVLTMCVPLGVTDASAAETSTVTVTTGKYYTIKNVGSGNKYLNVYANSSANNANITLWEADGTSGEEFQFAKSGSSYIIIPRCAKKRAVNVYTASSAKAGNNVCTWTKTGDSTQKWVVTYEEAQNAYAIRSASNNSLCLTAAGKKNGANVSVQKYTGDAYQLWTCGAFSVESTDPSTSDDENQDPSTSDDENQDPSTSDDENQDPSTSDDENQDPSTSDDENQDPTPSDDENLNPSPSDNENQKPSTPDNTKKPSTADRVKAVKKQIANTYTKAKKLSGKKSFNGLCGTYVRHELAALGIINPNKDKDCRGDGNKFYGNVKAGKTSKGYTKVKLKGYCLADVVKKYGKNISNVLISYPYQYGGSYEKPGAGHVVFIHAVINGKVYYSESYSDTRINKKTGKKEIVVKEGSVRTKTVKDFDTQYKNMYGKPIGAVYFYK